MSSCKKSRAGAEIACDTVMQLLKKKSQLLFEMKNKKIAYLIMSLILYNLKQKADCEDIPVEEYSSTISFVVYSKKTKKYMVFNSGDSAIMVISKNSCVDLLKGRTYESGICSTTTKNAFEEVEVKIYSQKEVDSVWVFSDGAYDLVSDNNQIKNMLLSGRVSENYNRIKGFFDKQENSDDASFVAIHKSEKGVK